MGSADSKLLEAVEGGDMATVRMMVENGAKWRGTDRVGKTILDLAAEKGHLDIFRYFVDLGASITRTDYTGFNPFLTAGNYGHFHIVKYFLEEKGVDINNSGQTRGMDCLYFAAHHGNMEMLQYLVDRGATVYKKHGCSALHEAASKGDIEMMKYLIDKGANVNAREYRNVTPLHKAVFTGKLEVVKLLVSHGADTKVYTDAFRGTAVDIAIRNGQKEIADFLASQ